MRFSITLIILLVISACSRADDRASRYLTIMEASLNTTTLFYSRVSPEVAKLIKPVKMPPEAKEVAECVVGKAKDDGVLAAFDKSLEMNESFLEYIRQTPTLTLLTLENDEQFMKLQSAMISDELEPLQKHSQECGAIKMNMGLTKETGVYEAARMLREQP